MYNQDVFLFKGDGRSGEESSRGSSGCCLVQGCSRHSWWIKGQLSALANDSPNCDVETPSWIQVMVEVNTTKEDSFHYDPLWDEPVVTVREADYKDWVEEVEELKGE